MTMYRTTSHAKYDCRYHIVWIPKYRKKVLIWKLKLRLQEIINERSEELRVKVLKWAIEKDHVHLYVSMPPSLSVSKYVNFIKGRTAFVLNREFKKELRLALWKGALWAVGYFVATVWEINDKIVRNYIEEQESKEKESLNSDKVWG